MYLDQDLDRHAINFLIKNNPKISPYFDCTLVSPGLSTVILPSQMHMVLLVCSMAGLPPIFSFLATGDQGATGMGRQEEGTKTGIGPAIFQFMGLIGDLHCPKGGIFKIGMISN